MTPPPPDRGPSRSAAVYLVERLRNSPDRLDRATCCGRGPPALGGCIKQTQSLGRRKMRPLFHSALVVSCRQEDRLPILGRMPQHSAGTGVVASPRPAPVAWTRL